MLSSFYDKKDLSLIKKKENLDAYKRLFDPSNQFVRSEEEQKMEFMRHIIHQNDNPWRPNLAQRSSPKLINKSMIKSDGSRSEKNQYESEDQSDSEDG